MKYKAFPILLAGTFLSTSAVAQTVPTINTDYLDSLTGEKVTWQDASASDTNAVQIGDKFYKYTYNNIGNYQTTSDYIDDTLDSTDVTDVLFNNISNRVIYNKKNNSDININSDFVGNYGYESSGNIYNDGSYGEGASIGDIVGVFVGKYIETAQYGTYSTAIVNKAASIKSVTGDFINNYYNAISDSDNGGAITNIASNSYSSSIGNITGNFIANHMTSLSGARGGAIVNYAYNYDYDTIMVTIGNITGDFIGNYVSTSSDYADAYGGAIYNANNVSSGSAKVGNIIGNFIGNYVTSENGNAFGGAIYNRGTIGEIINSNFIDNYVLGTSAYGGAIYSTSSLNIIADNGTSLFSRNKANNKSNAIYLQGQPPINPALLSTNAVTSNGYIDLNLSVKNKGTITFDDVIDGEYYNINVNGDIDKEDFINRVTFNNKVNSVYDLTLTTTQMALGKNAVINIVHNYVAQNNPYLRLDLDAVNREVGQINIDGDVDGTTNVIVNVLQNKETAKEESIVFATATNDTLGDEDSFKIYRVIGSPYMWEVSYNDTNKQWGLYSTKEQNPDEKDDPVVPTPDTPDTPSQSSGPTEVAPEIIGFETLPNAGLAQTNGMVYNIMRKVGISKLYCKGCGFYDYNWDGEAFHNAWVDTTYNGLTIEAPVEIDAKVWGIEAGSDIQHDLNNKLGIFASYRQGNYEMNGKGEKYYSTIGSEIDIDSYLAGLYYRYDHNNWYAFATAYAGMQSAEIKTDDGISADTDGLELGGSIEGGYSYALSRTLSVTPSLGVFYSQINYDDATDSAGKTVEYNDLKQVELEAGAKFAHTQYTDDGFYSLYIKPSVVQTLVDGDEIDVTELGKVDTVEDKTLGRIEIGGNYGFNDNWSAYGWANYTFGSDYEATSLGAGLNYAW